MTPDERTRRWLASRGVIVWIALACAVLTAPSLRAGLVFDDYYFEVVLRKLPLTLPQTGPLDLFRFADGNPKTARALMDQGQLAWTADPLVRNAFLRPLAALTHVLDYAAWPRSPALMHAQSIFWLVAAVVAVGCCYRRLLGGTWVAGLAALLYAVDFAHGQTVAWLANRNALIAAALGFPVLWLHDRWRRDRWAPGRWLGPLLLAAALLAGESAVAVTAYLVAYALHVERGSWRARALSLSPYVAVVLLWRALYVHYGFGVYGSDLYLDPARSPGPFVAAFPGRYLALLLGQFALPPPDLAELYPLFGASVSAWMSAGAALVLGLLAYASARLWRSEPMARFFVTGLLLAAIPICSTAPGGRLLVFVGAGAMGLIALLVERARGKGERIAALLLLGLHLVLAPPFLALNSVAVGLAEPQEATDRAVPKTPEVAGATVVLLNPPNDGHGAALVARRVARGEPRPRFVLPLAGGTTEVSVTRVNERSLRIRPAGGFLEHTVDRNWRSLARPIPIGSVVRLSAMTVTVLDSTPDHRPAEALFEFDAPLDDPRFLWRRWSHTGFVPWSPPPIGETVRLPANGIRELALDLLENDRER